MKQKIHIHLGPHKTGSTSIQHYLSQNAGDLEKQHNVGVLASKMVKNITDSMAARDYESAGVVASALAEICREDGGPNYIISSEDFAGDLPGRGAGKRPYPQLWRNINIFEKAFKNFDCYYYFFVREKDEWLRSAYIQSLKHRTKFKSYDQFTLFIEVDDLWDEVLKKPIKFLGKRLCLIPFGKSSNDSSVERFLKSTGLLKADDWPNIGISRSNISPTESEVKLLELINNAQCSPGAVKVAKDFVLSKNDSKLPTSKKLEGVKSQSVVVASEPDIPVELQALWERSKRQIHTQTQPDLLPDVHADWADYCYKLVEQSGEFPAVSRQNMNDQKRILEYRFRGFPQICFLIGLSISYLRRDTQHTEKASQIFQRLWQKEYPLLLALLPTRWLISSFQSFAEHGINEEQKLIGTAGFYFGNLLKTYEGERSIENLAADAIYPFTQPQTEIGFHGMDRYSLGGTDLMVNTLSSLVALSAKDVVAGRVLQEFLVRMRISHTVFSRHDKSRLHHKVEIPSFSNCWSFFEEP